jgi:hypothetical protein
MVGSFLIKLNFKFMALNLEETKKRKSRSPAKETIKSSLLMGG